MSKTAAPQTQDPKAVRKPSVRFVPKLRQYESGIDYVRKDGFKDKITLQGYTAPTMEDERRILSAIEHDPYCGITTWENREMPADLKVAEGSLRVALAKNAAMESEMDAMRRELDGYRKAGKSAGAG